MEFGTDANGVAVGAGATGFAQVRSAWTGLAAHSTYFFQRPEWIELLAGRLEEDTVWIGAHDGERPAAALVLHRSARRAGGITFRKLLRVRLGEGGMLYEEALVDREALGARALHDLLDAAGRWHLLRLVGLRARSPWLELADRGHVGTEADGGVGVLDTSIPFADCWRNVPKNMRAAVRKARRKIGERGRTEIVIERSGPGLEAAYERFLALEASGWKGADGGALAHKPIEAGLWREYLRSDSDLQIRSLLIDGRLAAGQIAVTSARTLFLARIAYDEELAALSPSNVLMADLIEACCEDPAIDRIDCMMWQPWHQRWGMARESTHSLTVFNHRSVRGLTTRAAWRARERFRRGR